jgi:hypothetical protein
MRAIALLVALIAICSQPAKAADETKSSKVIDDCIGDNRFIYHAGDQLLRTSTFLPAGTSADFILKAPFKRTQPIM